MQTGIHDTALGAVRHIIQSEGFMGFYSGFKITIFREIPFAFIQFPIYEQMKVNIENWPLENITNFCVFRYRTVSFEKEKLVRGRQRYVALFQAVLLQQ